MFDLKMRHRPFSMMEYNALKNNIIIMWAMCCFRTETTECIACSTKQSKYRNIPFFLSVSVQRNKECIREVLLDQNCSWFY